MKETYIKLFSNCIIVDGQNRSLILDLQRENFSVIPKSLSKVLNYFNNKKSVLEVINLYGEENKKIVEEYLDFLIEKEFCIYVNFDEFEQFTDIDKKFEVPAISTNTIIEISKITLPLIEKIIDDIYKTYCRNVQIVAYDYISADDLKTILSITKNKDFRSIELVLKYSKDIFNFIYDIDKYNFSITELTLHNALDKNKKVEKVTFSINFLDYEIKSFSNCGVVDTKYFEANKSKVLESLNHNSCLNKKISIDKDGNIKNCPSMPESFGNIKDTSLEEALNHPNFKKYWNINKDQIEVCKDCEFRHICTDCRAFIEEPENQYSKPLKCGYSPYTNEWEEWSTNPLKQKAIEYYGMQDLVKKDA